MEPITVAIVDDHNLFLKGMSALLRDFDSLKVIMEASSGRQLFQKLQGRQPDVLFVDIQMPGMDGFQVAAMMRVRYPAVKVIALTQFDDDSFVVEMLKEGARAYLLKTAHPDEIEDAILSVMQTGYYVNDKVSGRMLEKILGSENYKPTFPTDVEFNETEEEVLRLVCEQFTTKEIIDKMNLSKGAVKGSRETLFAKTGARNMVGLALYAVFSGRLKNLPDSFGTGKKENRPSQKTPGN